MSETGYWLRTGRKKAFAFIHGVGAEDLHVYWQQFLKVLQNDEQMDDFDLFVWKYPTHKQPSLWSNVRDTFEKRTLRETAPRIKLLGGAWDTTYRTQLSDYQDVILLCHSMGGLVIKSWIIDVLGSGQSMRLDTLRHLSFYATPHNGAPSATIIAWNNQLEDMKLDSPFIADVGERWYDHVVAWKEKTPSQSEYLYNRYIPQSVFIGTNDKVVPYNFGSIRGIEPTTVIADHSEIIQPKNTKDTQYKYWKDTVEQVLHTSPNAPLDQSSLSGKNQSEHAKNKYNTHISGNVYGYVQGENQRVTMNFGNEPKEK